MVSFKISKVGTRYTPKPSPHRVQARNPLPCSTAESGSHKSSQLSNGPPSRGDSAADGGRCGTDYDSMATCSGPASLLAKNSGSHMFEGASDAPSKKKRGEVAKGNGDSVGHIRSTVNLQDGEASFAVNLFVDGFSIDRSTANGKPAPLGYEVMDMVYPYDRTSESFLRAIDGGWLPGDLLEDIPCTYVDGCVVCELRDYRNSIPSNSVDAVSSPWKVVLTEWIPTVRKVLLQPSTQTIVKDVASMAEETWSYKDFLEVEAKILMAIQLPLCLDPTPAVARKAYTANYNKLKFNIGSRLLRRYRVPKGGLSDRRQRLEAALKAVSRNGKSSKFLKTSLERNYEELQDGSTGFGLKGGVPGAISIPSVQVPSSPCSSAPATPSTASANESGGFTADTKLGTAASLLGKRDGKEFGERSDGKKQKLGEQGKVENYHQQHQKMQHAKQIRDLQRKQQQLIQQQRSLDSTSHEQITQLLSRTEQSSQFAATPSDMKAFCGQVDQNRLELTKPIQEVKYEESENLGQEWDNVVVDVKDEPILQEQFLHSDVLDGNPNMMRAFNTRQFGMPEQPLQWQQLGLMDLKSGLKLEKDVMQEDLLVDEKRLNPNVKPQMQLPGLMQYDSLSSTGQPLVGVPPGMGMGSMGTIISGPTLSLPTMSSPGPPKSPVQVGTPSFSSPGQLEPMLQSPQYSALSAHALQRRRSSSVPKTHAAPSPNSLSNSMPSPLVNSPSTGSGPLCSPNVKRELGFAIQPGSAPQPDVGSSIVSQGQKKPSGDNETALLKARQAAVVEIFHRMKLIASQKSSLEKSLPPPNKNPPSFQMLAVALSNNTPEDHKEAKGHRSMANSLVGGNINARKTRYLQFSKIDQLQQGHGFAPLRLHSKTRLVLCGRGKDTMVEAVVQMGDDQDDDSSTPPHHVLPTMANPEKADQFATQYATLMEKEGWELIEDQVQAAMPRGASAMTNAASSARPMPAGATTLGNTMGQPGSSPRMPANQQHMSGLPGPGSSPLNPMQPPSPNALAAARMPPPANSARQIMGNHLGQPVASKPIQMDVTGSQLTVAQQQQQQHQQQQQQQQQQLQLQQQQQHQQSQRPQQLLGTPQFVAQLAAHNNGQAMSHASQIQQLQLLHRHQQQQNMLQRKMMLPASMNMSMNGGSNLSGMNGVGLPVSGGSQGVPISNLPGLGQMAGMTNSMGAMPGLPNMGQLPVMPSMGQAGGVANMMQQQLRPGLANQAQTAAAAAIVSKRLAVSNRGRTTGTGNSPVRSAMDNLPMAGSNQMHATSGGPPMGQAMARPGMQAMQRTPVAGMGFPQVGAPVMAGGANGQGYYVNQQQLNNQQMTTRGLGTLVGGPPSPQIGTQGLGSVARLTSSGMDLQNVSRAGTLAAVTAAGRGQVRRPMLAPQPQTGQPGQPSH